MSDQDADARPTVQVAQLADLAHMPTLPVGTVVRLVDRGEIVLAVGFPPECVAAALGWSSANVWLRDAERRGIEERHPIFDTAAAVSGAVVGAPLAVHEDRRRADAVYFIAEVGLLRALGATVPQSAAFIDLAVQLHRTNDATLYRVFHLSLTRRNKGGRQLWP